MFDSFQKLFGQLRHRKALKSLKTNIAITEMMCERLEAHLVSLDGLPVDPRNFQIWSEIKKGSDAWEDTFRITAHHIAKLDPVLYKRGWRALRLIEELESHGGER